MTELKKSKNNLKNTVIAIAVTVVLVTLVFGILEFMVPFYYLIDDNVNSYFCYYDYVYESAINGELAVYNFHQFMGEQAHALGQTGTLNPFVYISCFIAREILGNKFLAMEVMGYICLISSAIGMYILLKKAKCSEIVAVMGAVTFALNPFSVYGGSQWIIISIITALLPWMIYTDFNYFVSKKYSDFCLAVLVKTMLVYSGHPQFFVYAFIIDILAMVTFVLVKQKASVKYFFLNAWDYVKQFIFVVILSSPILVPMWKLMNETSQRSGKIDFDDYAEITIKPMDYLISNVYPHIYYKGKLLVTEYAFVGPICFLAAVCGLVYLIRYWKLKTENNVWMKLSMVPMVGAFFMSGVGLAVEIMYLIPILNRFRWPFKFGLYFIFALVIFSCVFISEICKKLKMKNVVIIILASVQILSMMFFMFTYPRRLFSQYSDSETFMNNEIDERLKEGRYIDLGFDLEYTYRQATYYGCNTATVYGLDNYYGYGVMSNSTVQNDNFRWFTGAYHNIDELPNEYSTFGERAVRWYLVPVERNEELEDMLLSLGFVKTDTTDVYVLYEDPSAKPMVYDEDINSIPVTEYTNKLVSVTPDSFNGGDITFNYVYNRNFHAYVDGEETEIFTNADSSYMRINVPEGSHEIRVEYKDTVLAAGLVASALCVLAMAGYGIWDRKKIINK